MLGVPLGTFPLPPMAPVGPVGPVGPLLVGSLPTGPLPVAPGPVGAGVPGALVLGPVEGVAVPSVGLAVAAASEGAESSLHAGAQTLERRGSRVGRRTRVRFVIGGEFP